jgi:F-type H+-transporting ATPase subunit delta
MASFGGSVARRYARALFELGVDRGRFEAFGAELAELAAMYASSPELRQTLENPVFKLDQRRAVLSKLLPSVAPSGEVQTFASLLLDRSRLIALPAIARAYAEMVDAKLGRVNATVTSAQPLDPATRAQVQAALEKRTGKKVVLTTGVDPSLIGGIVARVGDLVLDGSLRTRLATLQNRILN